jgi:hypothetical protein
MTTLFKQYIVENQSAKDMKFQPGHKVTYQFNKKTRGNAVIKTISSAKKDHAYIETEKQGTLLVPFKELMHRD